MFYCTLKNKLFTIKIRVSLFRIVTYVTFLLHDSWNKHLCLPIAFSYFKMDLWLMLGFNYSVLSLDWPNQQTDCNCGQCTIISTIFDLDKKRQKCASSRYTCMNVIISGTWLIFRHSPDECSVYEVGRKLPIHNWIHMVVSFKSVAYVTSIINVTYVTYMKNVAYVWWMTDFLTTIYCHL